VTAERAATSRFSIAIRGPFSLAAARELQCGFLRGSRSCGADADSVKLAFPRDGSFNAVGVELKRCGERIEGMVIGAGDSEGIRKQVERVLALDHDGDNRVSSDTVEDMGKRPSRAHSLDRIDGTKGYEPGNCRWATRTEQQRSRKVVKVIEHDGRAQSIAAWAEEAGLETNVLANRLARGWDMARALATPGRDERTRRS
jgi:hypothetical protein